jgi:hypothetical protein
MISKVNAQDSTGPRSEESKKRTRLNGLSPGLTGQTIIMPHEDQAKYEAHCAKTMAAFNPADDAEQALAQTIANESWRLNRARAIEENIFSLGLSTSNAGTAKDQALNQAMTYLDHAKEIQLLSLYAGRIARSIDKPNANSRPYRTNAANSAKLPLRKKSSSLNSLNPKENVTRRTKMGSDFQPPKSCASSNDATASPRRFPSQKPHERRPENAPNHRKSSATSSEPSAS